MLWPVQSVKPSPSTGGFADPAVGAGAACAPARLAPAEATLRGFPGVEFLAAWVAAPRDASNGTLAVKAASGRKSLSVGLLYCPRRPFTSGGEVASAVRFSLSLPGGPAPGPAREAATCRTPDDASRGLPIVRPCHTSLCQHSSPRAGLARARRGRRAPSVCATPGLAEALRGGQRRGRSRLQGPDAGSQTDLRDLTGNKRSTRGSQSPSPDGFVAPQSLRREARRLGRKRGSPLMQSRCQVGGRTRWFFRSSEDRAMDAAPFTACRPHVEETGPAGQGRRGS